VPGNDDAIRSCSLFLKTISDAIGDARQMVTPEQFAAEQEATEVAEVETVGAGA
jgi:ribosomal protein S2